MCDLFGETIRNTSVILLLSVGGGALVDRLCMVFQRMVVSVVPVCI